ncbi:lysoplasmalogenase family protein [Flavobacterium sp. XGLA_31]|uniref:lysoplasmalogenase family protein n=1 Tax=Flavobacterium sp. XGLA_31 TaxID=3447666 RepID=UPI003F348FB9
MQKTFISIVKALTIIYFITAVLEVIAEYFMAKSFIFVLKPFVTMLLLVLYCTKSEQPSKLFVTVLSLSLVTNLLFIPNKPIYLYYALIVFTIHRVLELYLIFSLQKVKDYIPLIIATAPFMLIFFYLFMETQDIPEESYMLLVIQNILISLFAGVALSSYVMDDNKQNSILLISALLFVMLQFSVFVEKFYLANEFQQLFRPLAMALNALAFFSLYKYVISAEKSTNNN